MGTVSSPPSQARPSRARQRLRESWSAGTTDCMSASSPRISSSRGRKSSRGVAVGTRPVPRTTTPLSRLEPATAPKPHWPSAWPVPWMRAALRASFSPAGPITRALAWRSPTASHRTRCAAKQSSPQASEASSSSARSSRMARNTGRSARPVRSTPSQPAHLSSAGHWPPTEPWATCSTGQAAGDSDTAAARPALGAQVPVSGPTPRKSTLAGSRAPVPAGTRSQTRARPSPTPPTWAGSQRRVSSTRTSPAVRSATSRRPVQPRSMIHDPSRAGCVAWRRWWAAGGQRVDAVTIGGSSQSSTGYHRTRRRWSTRPALVRRR